MAFSPSAMELSGEEFVVVEERELHGYNADGIPLPKPEELVRIRKWLDPTNYDSPGGELSKNQNYYTPHTGKWLREAEEYKQLFSSPNVGLLWIQGIPGSGKSVIASRLVNELSKSGVPICYFFFREIIQRNRTQRSMVLDWLSQLVEHYPPAASRILQLREQVYSNVSISTSTLWGIFSEAAVAMRKIYIVVDALDEMDPAESERCLESLAALAMQKPASIKIIATSRQNPEIQNAFKGCPAMVSLRLDRDRIDKDIAWYAAQRLKDATNIQMEEEAQDRLVQDLVARGNGLFLYVKLTLDEMLLEDGQLQEAETLPNGISDMYGQLLEKHRKVSGQSLDTQILILQAVIFSTETLPLAMLANILNTQRGEEGLDRPLLDSMAIIRRICGPLLEIKDSVVHIVHHSFTEYLINKNDVRGPNLGPFPVLQAIDAHRALCEICLTYLTFDRFKQAGEDLRPPKSGCIVWGAHPEKLAREEQYPFLKYAVYNWGYHGRLAGVNQESIFLKMTEHLETELTTFTQLRGDGLDPYPDKCSPLHIAAGYGIKDYVDYLLQRGADVEALDIRKRTPVMYSAKNGHLDVFDLLTHQGANIEVIEKKKWTPLHFAAKNGHHKVVRRLLELGVAPNPDGLRPHKWGLGYPSAERRRKVWGPPPHFTPIRLAIEYGHREVVLEILPHLKPQDLIIKNSRGKKGKTIVHYAASKGRAQIVSDILKAGLVDVNHSDSAGRTPLVRAIREDGNARTVKILLEYGADFYSSYALHHCCKKDSADFRWGVQKEVDIMEIASTLMDAGADINSRDEEGNTPLFFAAAGSLEILEWFIKKGADVHLRNAAGQTALHQAGRLQNMVRLIRGGADVNAQDDDRNTPLLRIKQQFDVKYHWPEILKLFVKHGADPCLRNDEGNTALHSKFTREDGITCEMIEKLVDIPGLDVNSRDRLGRTLLHYAGGVGGIPAGVDLNVTDWEGNTPLHVISDPDTILSVIRAGANLEIKNRVGKLPFHIFLAQPSLRLSPYQSTLPGDLNSTKLRDILSKFDLNAPDDEGNTGLHIFAANSGCREGSKEIIALLVELGADIAARNRDGKTALHLAAAHNSDSTLFGKGVHDVDNKGRTALHYAAGSDCTTGLSTQKLLDAGACPKRRDQDGRTALHFAAQAGNANALYILTKYLRHQRTPISVDIRDYNGRTPLHDAVQAGNYAAVKCLTDAGAGVHKKTFTGRTPLHTAAQFAHPLKRERKEFFPGVSQEKRDWKQQRHLIRQITRLLLEQGASAHQADKDGYLPLHVAGDSGNSGVLEALYEWDTKAVASGLECALGAIADHEKFATWALKNIRIKPEKDGDRDKDVGGLDRLMKMAAASDVTVKATRMTARLRGPREALWTALAVVDEAAVLSLLKDPAVDFDEGYAKPQEDPADDSADNSDEGYAKPQGDVEGKEGKEVTGGLYEWEGEKAPFRSLVVQYVIRQGWTAVLPAAIEKFGLDDEDVLAVTEATDPNFEMLELLLERNECGKLLQQFARSDLPWHPEAVKILIAHNRGSLGITGELNTEPTPLHTVLGWNKPSNSIGAWAHETFKLILACENIDLNAQCPRLAWWHRDTVDGPFQTPLMLAAKISHSTVFMEALIQAGADVNLLSPICSCFNSPRGLKILLDAGARLPGDQYQVLSELFNIGPAGSISLDQQTPANCASFAVLVAAGLDPNAMSIQSADKDRGKPNDGPLEIGEVLGTVDLNEVASQNAGAHTGFGFFGTYPSDTKYREPHAIIHDAAVHGGTADVIEAILSSTSLDARDASGRTPLLLACCSKESTNGLNIHVIIEPPQVAVRLLELGASPVEVDSAGYSALDCLFVTPKPFHKKRFWELFETLLRAGVALAPSRQLTLLLALNSRTTDYSNFANNGDSHDYIRTWYVWRLLQHGIQAGSGLRDEDGNTAMHLFLPAYMKFSFAQLQRQRGKWHAEFPPAETDSNPQALYDDVFKELFDQGSSGGNRNALLVCNNNGESPLHIALRDNEFLAPGVLAKVVECAGGPKAILLAESTCRGRTLLHACGELDQKGKQRGRESKGSDVIGKEQCPVMTRQEAFQYLLNIGLDNEIRDNDGCTALELASLMGHDSLVAACGKV